MEEEVLMGVSGNYRIAVAAPEVTQPFALAEIAAWVVISPSTAVRRLWD